VNDLYAKKNTTATAINANESFASTLLSVEKQKFMDHLTLNNEDCVTYSPTQINQSNREAEVEMKLAELRRIHEEYDYSNISCREEGFVIVEKRFQEAFPDEFEIAREFGSLTRGLAEYKAIADEYRDQAIRFYSTANVTTNTAVDIIERKNIYRGYEGMTYEEIEAVICDKYKGKNTLRDQLKLMAELKSTGVTTYNCLKNNVYLGPFFNDALTTGIKIKYNLYEPDFFNVNRTAFEMAMSGNKFSAVDFTIFTKNLPDFTPDMIPDVIEVFDKIFDKTSNDNENN
jgi:hypothetical protein